MKRTAAFVVALVLTAAAAIAQTSAPCATGKDLPRIPELVSKDGKLRGTIVTVAETQSIGTRVPNSAPAPGSVDQCYPQTVRALKGVGTDQPYPVVPSGGTADPMPGPTLRARVGDLVQLTFLNQIDMNRFPSTLDKGQCDQVSGLYPKATGSTTQDVYPNCFHGSTSSNIHFHGTHVNPNSTGDNVFVEIRPSLRTQDAANAPLVTQESVKADFDEFFKRCEVEVPPSRPLRIWPRTWDDLPTNFTSTQESLLKKYDSEILGNSRKDLWLWPTDAEQRDRGLWPQYYIGAFPYCYRIPTYGGAPPLTSPDPHAVHAEGKGSAEEDVQHEKPVQMGQSPGTHWYHAHKHGSTTINVSNGMTGAFIIEGQYDDDLNAFYGKDWTRTAKVMVINQLGTSPNLERGGPGKGQDKGPTFSINGRYKPVVKMRPSEVQMWRIVNTSSRAGVFIASFPPGFQWRQIAQDGVQLADPNYQQTGTAGDPTQTLMIASGNRVDLLVMAPSSKTTANLQVQYAVDPQDIPASQLTTLLTINVDGTAVTGNQAKFIPNMPAMPEFLKDITDGEIKGTKNIQFASAPPTLGKQHTIDGKQFSGEVGAVVLMNQAEEWKVSNATFGPPISHPFHIHVNPFQLSAKFDPNATLSQTNGAGTITVNNPSTGNQIVTGSGTAFTSAVKAGDWIWVGGNRATVLKVDSDTQLELPNGTLGAITTGTAYQVAVPLYTINAPRDGQCLINPVDAKPCGQTEQATNRIWWDVFPIPSGNTFYFGTDTTGATPINVAGWFKMRSRFVDYSGYYVMHCHILAHEDRGMMTVVEVAPLQSPYSHH